MNPYTDHPDHADADLEEPGLSALYRQGATQTPRSDLDRRILDQAQAALRPGPANVRQSGPRYWHWLWSWRWLWSKCRNGLPRWPWSRSGTWNWRQVAIPLSSAAGVLLAVGLVLRVIEEQSAVQGISGMAPRPLAEDRLSQQSQPPRPSTPIQPPQPTQLLKQSQSIQQSHSISPSKPEREVAAKRALEEASTLSAAARLSTPSMAPAAISTLAPSSAPAPASVRVPPAPAIGEVAQDQAENEPKDHERRPAIPMAEGAGGVHMKSQITHEVPQVLGGMPQVTGEMPQAKDDINLVIDERPQADPERWLAVIRQQWSSGQRAEAIKQLTAFRQVHPRYPLPEDLAPLMEAE